MSQPPKLARCLRIVTGNGLVSGQVWQRRVPGGRPGPLNWRYPAWSKVAPLPASAGLSCCLIKDTMSLAGLLSVIAEDPGLRHALSLGDEDADLVAPPAPR